MAKAKAKAKAKTKTSAPRARKQSHEAGVSEAQALRGKKPEELAEELLKLRKEQFALRMQRATGQTVKPDQFGKVRRNIARLKTVAREAELRAAAGDKK